jgi:hypothetical protein
LIRPENLVLVIIYSFFKYLGLTVLLDKEITVDFEQYGVLYNHGLIHEDCQLDFPTRTFNYINNDV